MRIGIRSRIGSGLIALVSLLPGLSSPAHAAPVATAPHGACARTAICIHTDPAPAGVDLHAPRPPLPAARTEGSPSGVAAPTCTGDGTSGPRVQLVYARPTGAPDRYDQFAASFQVWAAQIDAGVAESAGQTGGDRHIRFVHDASCVPTISRVALTADAVGDFGAFTTQIRRLHGDRTDRRFLVWMEAAQFCGVAELWPDDRPGWDNGNNGGVSLVGRVDSGCWGIPGELAEAHELFHTLGAVQASAPHSTGWGHCFDEIDRMCGNDGSGVPLVLACPAGREVLFDCKHDDYFSTDPAPGSYLATHWNTADSRFLTGPPAAPAGVGATSTEESAIVTWSGPTVGPPEITGFQVTAVVDGVAGAPVALPATVTSYAPVTLPESSGVTFTVAAVNEYGVGRQSPPTPPVVVTQGSRFHPLPPARILDTRAGNGAPTGPLAAEATLDLQVAGRGGVPAAGVSAVVLNVTVTEPVVGGFLTVWPAGGERPLASNLNVVQSRTAANLVSVKLGAGGRVSVFNGAGPTHVIADVAGWYGPSGATDGSRFHPLAPARILDTRTGNGAPAGRAWSGAPVDLQVAGRGGVPAAGVSAVVLNVTVTNPAGGGFLTAWPTADTRPLASNLNFVAGQTVPNLVTVKLGAGGQISLYHSGGLADLVADIAGWFGPDGEPDGARYHPVTPARLLDTRIPTIVVPLPWGPPLVDRPNVVPAGVTVDLAIAGQAGVPPFGASAVVLNVTAVDPEQLGFLTVWPAGEARPLASNLNFAAGAFGTVPNLVVAKLGAGGTVSLYNGSAGRLHMVVDVAGWYGSG